MAGAYAKIQSHEDLCAERYRAIHESIGDQKVAMKELLSEVKSWLKAAVFGIASIATAMGGAMAHEIYNNLQHQPPAQERAK